MFYHIKTKADGNDRWNLSARCARACQSRGDKMNLSTDSRANHLLTGETLLMYEAELE